MSNIVPVFGTGVAGKSVNVTAQKRVNLYVEESDDKTSMAMYCRPGLVRRFPYDDESGYERDGPIRGLLVNRGFGEGAGADRVYAAQGSHTLTATDSSYLRPGPPDFFLTSSGVVQMCNIGDVVLAVDGATGYRIDIPASLEANATFPQGATTCCAIASRFVVNSPEEVGRFYWSALADLTSWDALDYATAEAASDPLLQVFERAGELLLFGSRTLEFWQPTGADDVFARVGGSGIDWGLAVFDSPRKVNDSVGFIGRNLGGEPQVCMLRGYQVQVVSTPDVEKQLNDALGRGANPTTVVHTVAGHTWYIVNLDTTSYAYDVGSGVWDEWRTDGGRYAGQYAAPYQNTVIVTDYRDGRVYSLDDSVYLDDATPILREVVSKHVFNNTDRMCVDQITLDAEMGVGLPSGQGSDPQVMLQVSNDGGHTYGDEMWRSLGAQGKYTARAVWNRLGRARDFVFRWRIADPVKVVIMNIAARIRQ